MTQFSFPRQERLKSRKAISTLFEEGKSLYSYPIKILYSVGSNSPDPLYPVKCGFSVSKRNFPRAVDRNLLKRRMREAWRLNKSGLVAGAREKGIFLNVFVVYAGKETEAYELVKKSVVKGIGEMMRMLLNGKKSD